MKINPKDRGVQFMREVFADSTIVMKAHPTLDRYAAVKAVLRAYAAPPPPRPRPAMPPAKLQASSAAVDELAKRLLSEGIVDTWMMAKQEAASRLMKGGRT